MKQVSKSKVLELIQSTNGRIFTAVFTKKDGSKRVMNCRLDVSKGVNGNGLKYDPLTKGLLPVFEMKSKGFRMLNLETVESLQIAKEFYTVLD